MFDATEVVPINFVFFTASAIVAGVFTISSRVMRQIQLSRNLRHLLMRNCISDGDFIYFITIVTTGLFFSHSSIPLKQSNFFFFNHGRSLMGSQPMFSCIEKSISVSAPDPNA